MNKTPLENVSHLRLLIARKIFIFIGLGMPLLSGYASNWLDFSDINMRQGIGKFLFIYPIAIGIGVAAIAFIIKHIYTEISDNKDGLVDIDKILFFKHDSWRIFSAKIIYIACICLFSMLISYAASLAIILLIKIHL